MPLFNYKKNRVIPVLPPTPPRQNVYNDYSDVIPSPPPPPFIEDANSRLYTKNIRRQFKGTCIACIHWILATNS
jgi:hypothetical protein